MTGTGKTLLAKAAATETGATFIELKISDVVRGEIGESEKVKKRKQNKKTRDTAATSVL